MSVEKEVGYGKPPAHSRFKKGTSGNLKGRPKGTKNLRRFDGGARGANCYPRRQSHRPDFKTEGDREDFGCQDIER